MILGLDTATASTAVGLWAPGGPEIERRDDPPLGARPAHAGRLLLLVEEVLTAAGADWDAVERIAVGVGPGSFTGLRLGIATARGLAQARDLPLVGVSSLAALSKGVRPPYVRGKSAVVVAVIDARRGEVLHARYQPVPGGVQRVSAYSVSSPSDLVLELESTGEETLLAGDGVERYRAEFDALDRVEHAGASFAMPSPSALVELATARVHREEFESPYDVKPMYLRESDAELSWDAGR